MFICFNLERLIGQNNAWKKKRNIVYIIWCAVVDNVIGG